MFKPLLLSHRAAVLTLVDIVIWITSRDLFVNRNALIDENTKRDFSYMSVHTETVSKPALYGTNLGTENCGRLTLQTRQSLNFSERVQLIKY
jgi:hypothetical protein